MADHSIREKKPPHDLAHIAYRLQHLVRFETFRRALLVTKEGDGLWVVQSVRIYHRTLVRSGS
jgi:hypothetical protein